jgi:hypothetical protein
MKNPKKIKEKAIRKRKKTRRCVSKYKGRGKFKPREP